MPAALLAPFHSWAERRKSLGWHLLAPGRVFVDPGPSLRPCGFSLRIEIADREDTPALDTELEASLPQAPQQRVQALLGRLGGTG